MKILAIIGSPKGRGSGFKLVRMIEDEMKVIGKAEFEYLFLKDEQLKLCLGCYNCLAKGEEKCPLKDNRMEIEKRILTSDGVILSSPVYVMNISSLMKNFVERFAYANHRPKFFNQKVMTIVNAGSSGKNRALYALKYALGGSKLVHKLGIDTPPWPQTNEVIEAKKRSIKAAAKKYYKACIVKTLPRPTLLKYIIFLVQKEVGIGYKEYLPADYLHYRDKNYYYDTNINPIIKIVGKIIVQCLKIFIINNSKSNIIWPS